MIIRTIGHSTRSISRFLDLLAGAGVSHLVDVRRFPVSRRYPWFSRERLGRSLADAAIAYAHLEALGGHRTPHADSPNTALRAAAFRGYADHMQTPEFADALEQLLALAAGAQVAVMCAEARPAACHRSLLADALVARDVTVHHIGDDGVVSHRLHPRARLQQGTVTYPAAAAPRQQRLSN